MDVPEEFGLMHQPVHPVEIGIVNEQHQGKSQEIINLSVFVPLIKKVGVIREDSEDQCSHGRKNQNGNQREKNIS